MQHSQELQQIWRRQHRFETYILAFNEQLLKQQIVTTRRSIENRKLILSRNAYETQIALKEYNSRKLILQTLKTLKNIPSLKNDTIYRNQILNGVIQNTEIYKIIKQGEHNLTLLLNGVIQNTDIYKIIKQGVHNLTL